mgnify:CR=1 FL=1
MGTVRPWIRVLQIAFTYVGTVVGAGFASGKEILHFFTRYGWMATLTIGFASALFVWLGTKLMLIAHELNAESYEDMNKHLFGNKWGGWFSLFSLVVLFGITAVMLAGAGSVLEEHFRLSYQFGLLLTLLCAYAVIVKGIKAIMAVNTVVVPLMLGISGLLFGAAAGSPDADRWLRLTSDDPLGKIWTSPFLYVAFNLATAQAALVPLATSVTNRKWLKAGGVTGGVGIGLMLLGGHIALATHMPGIARFEIPMGHLAASLGPTWQLLFLAAILGEIFTTLVANVYGLSLQLRQRTGIREKTVIAVALAFGYGISQIGFGKLLTTLYPLFGLVSLIWLALLAIRRPNAR